MDRTTREMSDRHESFLARVFDGRVTKASGATTDKGDGRQPKGEQTYCFAWDAKSTRGRSISVKVADWEKLRDQTVGYRPMLPLRLYLDDRLVESADFVVFDVHDAAELIEMANKAEGYKTCADIGQHHTVGSSTCTVCGLDAYRG